jgi:phosphohistidine phosphatase
MRLYLVRHGEAKSVREDPKRSLTAVGVLGVRKIAAFLKPLHLKVQAIWHSGKARAAMTAEILGSAVTTEKGIVEHAHLNPDDSIGPVKKEVQSLKEDLMIVGHLPFLSLLASKLICGLEDEDLIVFREATVAALEREKDSWEVLWVVRPEILAGG